MEKARLKLAGWKAQLVTLCNKVQFLKNYILPLFLSLSYVLPIPCALSPNLYQLFFQFLWGGKMTRVKHGLTYHPLQEGGLGMINPEVFFCSFFLYFNLHECYVTKSTSWVSFLLQWLLLLQKVWISGQAMIRISVSASRYPPYAIRLMKMLQKWGVTLRDIMTLSRKQLYCKILEEHFLEEVAFPGVAPEESGETIKNMVVPGIPNAVRDVVWYGAYNKLLIRMNIRFWKIPDLCCPRPQCRWIQETQEHLFISCFFAVSVCTLLFNKLAVVPFNYESLVYGKLHQIGSIYKKQALIILLAISRYYLWNTRCMVSLGKMSMSEVEVVDQIWNMAKGVSTADKSKLYKSVWVQKWGWVCF
nr:PREDICTED: uncharacterized protein LOC106701977 [Latimeria chalumnae]|eukprot:XP_014339532.1 PREDICTED: uncharacterized protein LOC106701977 [Latimeria chalumnae]